MIVAIPQFKQQVAPSFEAARHFVVCRIDENRLVSRKSVECTGCEGFGRVQLLRDEHVEVLICNGINSFYRDLLGAWGMTVFADVCIPVEEALSCYLEGRLVAGTDSGNNSLRLETIPLEDLICWTRQLFTAHGYRVFEGADRAPFPVDLVAEIECAVCRRTVRVAICCGAHAYRCTQEIKLLSRVASTDYHARVYVHPASPRLKQWCEEFEIELIDPNEIYEAVRRRTRRSIPLLRKTVAGHERAARGGR